MVEIRPIANFIFHQKMSQSAIRILKVCEFCGQDLVSKSLDCKNDTFLQVFGNFVSVLVTLFDEGVHKNGLTICSKCFLTTKQVEECVMQTIIFDLSFGNTGHQARTEDMNHEPTYPDQTGTRCYQQASTHSADDVPLA